MTTVCIFIMCCQHVILDYCWAEMLAVVCQMEMLHTIDVSYGP